MLSPKWCSAWNAGFSLWSALSSQIWSTTSWASCSITRTRSSCCSSWAASTLTWTSSCSSCWCTTTCAWTARCSHACPSISRSVKVAGWGVAFGWSHSSLSGWGTSLYKTSSPVWLIVFVLLSLRVLFFFQVFDSSFKEPHLLLIFGRQELLDNAIRCFVLT